jgi:hypothetical protein
MGLGKAGSSAWGPKDADTLAFLQAAEGERTQGGPSF